MPRVRIPEKCSKCGVCRPASDWAKNGNGYASWCSPCNREYAANRRQTQDPATQQGYDRARNLRKNYRLTVSQYDQMLVNQDGVCAICGCPPGTRRLSVDHCHRTQRVRKLLCSKCNLILGHANDDVQILQAAINYLGGE